MKTVHEVSKLTGVSIRTLHYYDKIGLLPPTDTTESGYRLYDDTALERLQHILLFRELLFPLKDIKMILNNPDFDQNKALEQQIALLQLKKEHLEDLIYLAREIKTTGVKILDFSAFDTKKLDDYAEQAKTAWGHTEAYKEYEEKSKDWGKDEKQEIRSGLMGLFSEFGKMRKKSPASHDVQEQVKKLREYITAHFYTCTPKLLKGLRVMYAEGGAMTENINKAGGEGTAEFVAEAIEIYCS